MLKDTISFERVWLDLHKHSFSAKAVAAFISFLEHRFGADFVYNSVHVSRKSISLINLFELAENLRFCGVIRSYKENNNLVDEPRIFHWLADYAIGEGGYEWAGGDSVNDQQLALTKALAEAIERFTWFNYDSFLYLSATIIDIEKKGNYLHPKNFASYTASQREREPRLAIKQNDLFRWVKGYSWVKEGPTWIPVQIISGHKDFRAFSFSSKEPAIRASITTGLATHPVRMSALASGALEVIERDAYMIMWLNQLSLPRINLEELAKRNESLAELLKISYQYRFLPHAVQLLTDAPTHAICVVLEDLSGLLPKFSIGLKAHQDPTLAVEGALLEALRMHQVARKQKIATKNKWNPATKAIDVTHYDRLMYWSEEGRSDKLEFLIRGDVQILKEKEWEKDSDREHFMRIVKWCQDKGYELATVNFNNTPANIPKWNIEFVVIPELQPIYFNEKLPHFGGKRLQDIPKQFGYESCKPYRDDPHPFV